MANRIVSTLKLHKSYLQNKHPNNVIARFLNDMRSVEVTGSDNKDDIHCIDIEFGYRVLLSLFCNELEQSLKGNNILCECKNIYSACLRATEFNQIDSALLTVSSSSIFKISQEKYGLLFDKEKKFKNGKLEVDIGKGVFSKINASKHNSHLILRNYSSPIKKGTFNVDWNDGEHITRDISLHIERGGLLSKMPAWDAMLCSKIKNMGDHLGIGYQYVFLIIDLGGQKKKNRIQEIELDELYNLLAQQNDHIINTFTILNTLLLSFDIKTLLQKVAASKLTSLMTINFRHTLRANLIESYISSLTIVNSLFPKWSSIIKSKNYKHLGSDVINISEISSQKATKETVEYMLSKYNAILGEIKNNKVTQKYFSLDSSESYFGNNNEMRSIETLFAKIEKSLADVYQEKKIRVTPRGIAKLKYIKVESPIIPGIIFNVFENAYKYNHKRGTIKYSAVKNHKTGITSVIFENDITETSYLKLKNEDMRNLIRPFDRIDGKKHGMGLYYSYILLKEYFHDGSINMSVVPKLKTKYVFITEICYGGEKDEFVFRD